MLRIHSPSEWHADSHEHFIKWSDYISTIEVKQDVYTMFYGQENYYGQEKICFKLPEINLSFRLVLSTPEKALNQLSKIGDKINLKNICSSLRGQAYVKSIDYRKQTGYNYETEFNTFIKMKAITDVFISDESVLEALEKSQKTLYGRSEQVKEEDLNIQPQ